MCVFRTCAIFVQLYGFTIQKGGGCLEYNVKKMSQFAHFFSENEIRSQPVTQIPWSTLSRGIMKKGLITSIKPMLLKW